MIMYTIKLQLGPLFDLKCSDIARAEQICEGHGGTRCKSINENKAQ